MDGNVRRIRSMAFSPNGSKIVTSSADFVVQLWDVADESLRFERDDGRLPGWDRRPTPVAFSPDGRLFAFYHFAGWKERVRHELTGRMVDRGFFGRRIWMFDAETGESVRALGFVDYCPSLIAFLPDGATLLSNSRNKLRLWDVVSGEESFGHTCAWTRSLRYVEVLPRISAVMAVEVENHEQTLHEDWTTIAVVPFSSFQELPEEP
jgi:WD40 repeat protein